MNIRLVRHLLGGMLRGKRFLGTVALASVAGIAAWVSTAGQSPTEAGLVFREVVSTVPAATMSPLMSPSTSSTAVAPNSV